MTTDLRIAFLPLTDAAVLAVAREKGFAEEEGCISTLSAPRAGRHSA